MNILHIIRDMNIGGAQSTLLNIVKYLDEDHHWIVTYQIDSFLEQQIKKYSNAKCYVITDIKKMYGILKTINYDIVHYHWWPEIAVMYRFFSSENKPIILTLQEQFKPPKYKNIYYVAGSKDNMKYLDDIEDDFKNYIYLGVDPTSIIEKKEIKIYDTIWVGRVSTLIPTKIPKDLIDVFNTLSVPGKNIKFALYGTGGEKTIIELRTKKEKYPEMHLVIDTDKYVLDKYQNLDFFVYWLPEGCTESFGLVIVEAMLSKVPVIAQRAGAIPEIIQHGYNGYLFDDPSEINQYLNVLVQDERRKQVVLNAQRTANERFLAYNMAKKYKELYNERLKINEIKH